jgi:ESS family glutamate:Na+ symporter
MSGSISLVGGVATSLAWAPIFVEKLGISNALELGVASNTVGLIAACVIGGPIANYLIQKYRLQDNTEPPTIGVSSATEHAPLNYYGVLWAWFLLNLALITGIALDETLEGLGINLPAFVSCLITGIIMGNVSRIMREKHGLTDLPFGAQQGLSLIADICLGMFLTMALMGLQVWELGGILLYIMVIMLIQILLSVAFTCVSCVQGDGKRLRFSGN